MSWIPNDVRSIGLDPVHHEEIRNGPENKIHTRKVVFRGSEKFRCFDRILLECSRGNTSGSTTPGGGHLDSGMP